MSVITQDPPVPRLGTRQALVRKRRGWFFGLTGDQFVKYVFRGNAMVSILVLALITFTIFRDGIGFFPANHENLVVYRQAGLEYVDIFRGQITSHTAISRYLAAIRTERLKKLMSNDGLSVAAANAQLAGFDDFSDRFADSIGEEEAILGNMVDLASSIKERKKISSDLRESKRHYLDAMRGATPGRAAELRKQADAITPGIINFKIEIRPLLAMGAEVPAANATLLATMNDLAANAPKFADPELARKMGKFTGFVADYVGEVHAAEKRMTAWDQDKPVGWTESFTSFAFGRKWISASFWQDWYGVVPLFTGSLLIAFLALLIAIPLGVAAAVYVNQLARPAEQKIIKPYIEFISAIPSVVLGFFGIAMLGETLRLLSQWPSLSWVPGFPIAERLNATTAACLLALMAVPTIFSLAEDALNNVPRSFREASLALGATRLQTIVKITIPAALSGIMAAILLGFGRVIGETMVVLLCAGNRIEIPDFTRGAGVIFQPVHTMTGIIAQEMGEVVRNSIHYRALFMVGGGLFLISLLVNWLAQKIVRRYRTSIG